MSPGLHNSLTQAFQRADKVLFPYQSCLFCQTIPPPDVQRATRGSSVLTQLIFHCDKMLAQLMLNVTLATGPPLQIRSEDVSFSKTFLSLSLSLSSALSIHPPDVTCRSRRIKRDVQFPTPSPSEENKGSAYCFSHCWLMTTSHSSARCVCMRCQLCTCEFESVIKVCA